MELRQLRYRTSPFPSSPSNTSPRPSRRLPNPIMHGERRPRAEILPPRKPHGRTLHRRLLALPLHLPRLHDAFGLRQHGLRLAARSSLRVCARRLAHHLHRVSALLLRHEEAGYRSRRVTVEGPASTICCVDVADRFYYSLLYRWYTVFIHKQYVNCHFLTLRALDWISLTVHSWETETFDSSYINIPIILGLYFGYKVFKKTKIVSLEDMPIRHFIDIANANPEPPAKPLTGWRRFNILWS